MLLKLTLDTNCVINLLDASSTTTTSLEELTSLMRHTLEGRANLCVTTALSRDVEHDRDDERRQEMLRRVVMFPVVGGLFRLDASVLNGSDKLASDEERDLANGIQSLLFPGLSPNDRRFHNKIADVDHLVSHKLSGRDLFVTEDRGMLTRSDALLREYGVRVVTPTTALDELERTINLALVAEDFRENFDAISRLIERAAENGSWSPAEEDLYRRLRRFLLRTFPKIRDRLSAFRHTQGVSLQNLSHDPDPFRGFYEQEDGSVAVEALRTMSARRARPQQDDLHWLRSEGAGWRTLLTEFVGEVES